MVFVLLSAFVFDLEREVSLPLALSAFLGFVTLLTLLATAGAAVGVLEPVKAGMATTRMWIIG